MRFSPLISACLSLCPLSGGFAPVLPNHAFAATMHAKLNRATEFCYNPAHDAGPAEPNLRKVRPTDE
jgi:hypothetical protein